MPSPFPGMDPYLEGSQWTGVHTGLSVEIARQLSPRLSPRYVARTNERLYVTEPDAETGVSVNTADIYPDAYIAQSDALTGGGEGSSTIRAGAATELAPLQIATVMPEAVRLLSVEIRDTASRELVTAIEVLSPVNKSGRGRRKYLAKRRRVLFSPAHLIEIDLCRTGLRVPMQKPLPPSPYFVLLSRAERRPWTAVWPISLADQLPSVPVPLLAGDADVPLDLQQAFTSIYDTFRYELTVDYSRPPEVSFKGDDVAWAAERIRARREDRKSE